MVVVMAVPWRRLKRRKERTEPEQTVIFGERWDKLDGNANSTQRLVAL